MLTYRVGFPGWKVAARLGMPLMVKVEIAYDTEAGCFIAISNDFNPKFGIAVEGETWDEILKEVDIAIDEAMESVFRVKPEDVVKPYFVPTPVAV